ncbi:MAG TPA: isoprenylcysteine carboxylmethyltransferase family protein [Bryobacteraceae bacterium]|nr:isoprenylcysteine carboxylmethyltransferase family protein [Bryobacteraceae bacterium]
MKLVIRPDVWIEGSWIAFIVIWLATAAATKRTTRMQSSGSRLLQGGLAAAGAILLLARSVSIGWLGLELLPDTAALAYTGAALTFAGIAFAVWARFVIGRNWSGTVTIKQDHELIRGGPYALVRHPIYTGVLLAIVGTALAVDEVRGLIAIVLVTAGFWLKLRTEETFMLQQFGDRYRRYQQEVKALIPFVV